MSTSLSSSSETEGPSPDPPSQKLTSTTQRQSQFAFKNLTIRAKLAILLECAVIIFLAAFWTLTRQQGPEEIVSYGAAGNLSAQISQADAVQAITEISSIAERLPQQNLPPTPFLQPEPLLTPALSPDSTRVISDTPTLTPTPSPTATRLPPATDTPLPTPTSSLTATSLPTATDTPTSAPTPSPTATPLPPATNTPTPTTTLQPEIKQVIIISIDGLRPDALALAEAPYLDNLIAGGAYCPNAQTVKTSETLPSHASMLGGMIPEKHGILWGVPYMGWPGMNGPTLFSEAHNAGLSTAMVFGKEKMNYLALPNTVDKIFGADAHDPQIKDWAIEMIQAGLPTVLFIHFPDTDRVGHAYGWMSPNQFQSIAFVDGLIGELLIVLENKGYLDSTLLIITSDHGGHGFRHGDDAAEDRTIPWLAVGPGVPPGITLTVPINTYDTAATALHALKLPIPDTWDGKPILEIFE